MWKLVLVSVFVGSVQCSSVRLLTFNAGLASALPRYDERKAEIASSINRSAADIVCMQEVWFSSEIANILTIVNGTKFPYSFSALHDGNTMTPPERTKAPCPANAAYFLACMQTNCSTQTTNAEVSICAREKCMMFDQLDQECVVCLTVSDKANPQNCITGYGVAINLPGLLLLSNSPLKNTKLTWYIPDKKQFLPRAYITAEVDDVGTVVCTHFTADLGPVYFEDLTYAGWEEQNLAETGALLEAVKPLSHVVMLGDFNCGPGLQGQDVLPTFLGTYNEITTNDFASAVGNGSTTCTFCASNPLTESTNTSLNWILDHVFIRGHSFLSAERVYDANLSAYSFPLSDHYGVEAVIERSDDANAAAALLPRLLLLLCSLLSLFLAA